MLVLMNIGEVIALELLTNAGGEGEDLTLHLFSNDVTPAKGHTAAQYTEVSGGGYTAVPLLGASWVIVEGSGVTPSRATYAQVPWVFTSVPAVPTIYGYYVTSGSDLVWAERHPSPPFTVANAGGSEDEYRVTPVFALA